MTSKLKSSHHTPGTNIWIDHEDKRRHKEDIGWSKHHSIISCIRWKPHRSDQYDLQHYKTVNAQILERDALTIISHWMSLKANNFLPCFLFQSSFAYSCYGRGKTYFSVIQEAWRQLPCHVHSHQMWKAWWRKHVGQTSKWTVLLW